MSAIVISDIHIRDPQAMKTQLLLRFLQEEASKFDDIYILGDLFDVWPGTTPYLIKAYASVTDALRRLVKEGHSVHYIEGNHDFKLGAYFTNDLGIRVHDESFVTEWGGKKVYMMHGDLGNKREIGYRLLRYTLRNELLHVVLKAIPPKLIYDVGLKTSKASRKYQTKIPLKSEAAIRQIYRNTAEEIFAKGYDIVLMGHTHLPDDVSTVVDGRQCRYINTGDWVKHFTYVEFDGAQLRTKSHPVKDL